MRHRVYGKHLGRNKDQRRNLFKGLVRSLLLHGTIQTSEAKAKAIKGLVDKVINSAKKNPKSVPQNLQELVSRIIPKLGTRTSGFTQVVRMGTRLGDQTMMVRMSLIGAEELKPLEKESRVPPKARLARLVAKQRAKGGKSLESSKKEIAEESVKVKQEISKSIRKTKTIRLTRKERKKA